MYLFLQVPDKIIQSAAHLLLSVTTTIRPAFLFQIPAVVTLYESASQGNCQNLAQEVQATHYNLIIIVLIFVCNMYKMVVNIGILRVLQNIMRHFGFFFFLCVKKGVVAEWGSGLVL